MESTGGAEIEFYVEIRQQCVFALGIGEEAPVTAVVVFLLRNLTTRVSITQRFLNRVRVVTE